MFRSTGSYEPDHQVATNGIERQGFDPQALTSLTTVTATSTFDDTKFRSTGSYEPDLFVWYF